MDNSGSINRRIVLFEFTKRVDNGDMELGKKLGNEMAAIVLKANRGYRWAVSKFARDNIWKHLPEEFHRAKKDFTESVNSLVQFLNSGLLELDKNAYMPLEHFTSEYVAYTQRNGLPKVKTAGDSLSQPLMGASCYITKATTKKYPRNGSRVMTTRWVVGADLVAADPFANSYDAGNDPLGG